MDWRKEINLQEISTTQINKPSSTKKTSTIATEYEDTDSALDFENTFEKPISDGETKFNKIEAANDAHKDLITAALLGLSSLGAMSMIFTGNVPARGVESLLGIDLHTWWVGSKFAALAGIAALPPALLKLRGKSAPLDAIFNFLPHKGRYRMKELAMVGFMGFALSQSLFMVAPHHFKTNSEWRTLEKMHLDSPDPLLRKQFKQEKEIISVTPMLPPLPVITLPSPEINFPLEVQTDKPKANDLPLKQNSNPSLGEKKESTITVEELQKMNEILKTQDKATEEAREQVRQQLIKELSKK